MTEPLQAHEALAKAAAAYADADAVADRLRGQGRSVLRVIGSDTPLALLRAAGFAPVRLVPRAGEPTPFADTLLGPSTARKRPHQLVERLFDPAMTDPVLFTRADAEQAQIYSAIRENARLGAPGPRVATLLDLLHLDRQSSRAYNETRLTQLCEWLVQAGGRLFDDRDLGEAADSADRISVLLQELDRLRTAAEPRLSGTDMLRLIGCAAILPPEELEPLLRAVLADADVLPVVEGRPVLIAGSAHELDSHYAAIEAEGWRIVGERHEWGTPRIEAETPRTLAKWASPVRAIPGAAASSQRLADEAAGAAYASGVEAVFHLCVDADEAAPWQTAALYRALDSRLPLRVLKAPLNDTEPLRLALRGEEPTRGSSKPLQSAPTPRKARSRKLLKASAASGNYQREWFGQVREQVAAGAPFAVVNANAPQEILRALDIPFVVNQWWASIVAAKQQSGRYRDLLRARHYPADVEAYSAQGIAATLDENAEQAPWGGLPRPDFVHAVASSDATPAIFEAWAHESGAVPFVYERTVDPRWKIETRWWEVLPEHWDKALEPERLDLLTAELRQVVAELETATGRTFDEVRFVEVMNLVNEQEDYYRRTRNLIARTVPAPIGIVDSMPATMVPQWHRGTAWGRDAAKALYDEVAARVSAGDAVVAGEKVRLMWVGRGLWSDTAFYQKWEESHGAVFVWSMYLALAADGYIRSFDGGRDPMRALAARFLTMGDELRMPSWAAPWHVYEAQTHGIDGAVALTDADPFVLRALAAAGIPVLELGVDNYALDGADAGVLEARIAQFIEGPCMSMAERRLSSAA
jgi:benzoyl-CoA reductase/2-hydroxyglutaryl-CoA dehydratase subunit BcrC/BadD/HgdB